MAEHGQLKITLEDKMYSALLKMFCRYEKCKKQPGRDGKYCCENHRVLDMGL